VSHPHVIPLLDWAQTQSKSHPSAQELWLLLPLFTGGTLYDALTHKPYPEIEALALMEGVCSAVAAIHAAGYTHRDVKALNVLLTPDASPVLMDFGSCRPLEVTNLTPF